MLLHWVALPFSRCRSSLEIWVGIRSRLVEMAFGAIAVSSILLQELTFPTFSWGSADPNSSHAVTLTTNLRTALFAALRRREPPSWSCPCTQCHRESDRPRGAAGSNPGYPLDIRPKPGSPQSKDRPLIICLSPTSLLTLTPAGLLKT